MSKLLRDLPISRKLNLLVVLATTISLFLSASGILVLDVLFLKDFLINDLRSQARVVANTANVNLYFDSSFKASEMADIFAVNPTILEAALFDKDGKLVKDEVGSDGEALYQRDRSRPFQPPREKTVDGGWYENGSLVVCEPINYSTGQEILHLGHVFVRSDLSKLRNQVTSHLKFLAGVFLASFGLAYLVSKRFQSFIADPIRSLAQKTADISQSGDYSLRQPKTSLDEIGDLTDSFNDMLEAIQRREHELSSTLAELRLRDDELVTARNKAEEGTKAKSQFLAHMSHEIRTPMNGIIGMTNVALKTKLSDSQREYLSAVKTSADSLLAIINEILDFSKIEAGHLELDPVPFDFQDCVSQALQSVALQAHLKNLELGSVIDHRLPSQLVGDPLRIRQILINLLGNALKFTTEGSVQLRVKLLEATSESVRLEVRVSDTGIGIAKERQSQIFESFTQADSSTSRNFGGTGLGLTITALLVEMMQGRIWVESNVGAGSTFLFTMMLQTVSQPADEVDLEVKAALAGRSLWLLCDDDCQIEGFQELMLAFDAQAEIFRQGSELESRLLTETPSLLFADANLRSGNGIKLLAKAQQAGVEHTCLLLRTSSLSEEMTHYRSLGIGGHLLKPVRPSDLRDLLLRQLAPETASRLENLRREETSSQEIAPLRVLVTDDNEINRRLARIMLEGYGCVVDEAESGEAVLQLLSEGTFPDLLLLDIMMPGMDGFECTRQVRELETLLRLPRLPIIALTAHALKGYEERCLEADMDGYLSKPIDADRMFEVLARYSADHGLPVSDADRAPIQEEEGRAAEKSVNNEESEESQDELKVLDLDIALQRVGGNLAILKTIATAFLGASRAQLEAVEKAVVESSPESLRFAAHTFKGTVLNFEARKTASRAQILEDLGATGNLQGAPAALDQLKVCYDELRVEMEKL